ncbi:hypothetical protein [Desertivirga xinjiangensis]|uniref:hypothetical protein n=1 Tax=Desertivirga xinjiangensis TaxID=539206 RepID=UPI0021091BFD|nr:hypothetical protein [Pedobacter xinjiangensis]
MAIIDRNGILHGSMANNVYKGYRNRQVIQGKPKEFKQTLASKASGLEFGLCSTTAKAIRHAFIHTYSGYDGQMINRMNSAVRNGVSASRKACGERDVHDADLSFLQGFQFNNNSPMDKVLRARPQTYLDAENKICINLPPISIYDIKGPGDSNTQYALRFVAIAFDFKKEVYCYNSVKEIKIAYMQDFEGGVIRLEDAAIKGRLVMLSMSIHGYKDDGFGGLETINSKAWSPSELIGAWQIAGESEVAETNDEEAPAYRVIELVYWGNRILDEIKRLRQKAGAPKKVPQKARAENPKPRSEPWPVSIFELPKGDIGFPKD